MLTLVFPRVASVTSTCHAVDGRALGAVSNAVVRRVWSFWEAAVFALAVFCFSVRILFRGLALSFGLAFARVLGFGFGLVADFTLFVAGFFVVDAIFLLVVVVRPVCAFGFPGVLTVAVTVAVAYDRHCVIADLKSADCL